MHKLQKLGWIFTEGNRKKNTIRAYETVITKFTADYADAELDTITADDLLTFLNKITNGRKPQTKHNRFAHLSAFFNFVRNNLDPLVKNPCQSPLLQKVFRSRVSYRWNIPEKDTIDEVIFRTTDVRNRLLLELMARGGMRISEVLKLTPNDILDRKLILREPKSGRENEIVFIPQKLADKLRDFALLTCDEPYNRIFPISYEAARIIVAKAGKLVGIHLKPHDLRRHAATHASRSGVPIEIVSKIILRHSSLSTTQRYLGKVTDVEAMRWIENLYG